MSRLEQRTVHSGTAVAVATIVGAAALLSSSKDASDKVDGDPSLGSRLTSSDKCQIPPKGPISVEQLPEGSSVVECDVVGRVVVWRGDGVTIPSPGHGMDLFVEPTDATQRQSSFGVFVSPAGTLSYEFPSTS